MYSLLDILDQHSNLFIYKITDSETGEVIYMDGKLSPRFLTGLIYSPMYTAYELITTPSGDLNIIVR